MSAAAEVVRAGPLTTVQDRGRPGLAHLGVPHAGAADLDAMRRANLLAGNAPDAAALETTLAGPALRFAAPARVALAGAPAPVTVDGAPAPFGAAFDVAAGALLDVGVASAGVRTYLAVAGGIDVPAVLGSRSRDTLTGLGPAPLARGDVLRFGAAAPCAPAADPAAGAGAGAEPVPGAEVVLHVGPGPRQEWFAPRALAALTTAAFTVSPASNRIGVRLGGAALERLRGEELPSEGLVRGAIQVPGSGEPIVMLADHPTTGGYPVIAVVAEADHGLLGQLRPGTTVRFARVD